MSVETFTAFTGRTQIATGDLSVVAQAAFTAATTHENPVLIFDDQTGQTIELDLRHSAELAVAGYRARFPLPEDTTIRPGRGRPKLGVVAREVTLLPRHWDWLSGQPGGASAALRRLVEQARRDAAGPDRVREGRQALYSAMSVLAGDLADFEDATRALFANDAERLTTIFNRWPSDVSSYLGRLKDAYLS